MTVLIFREVEIAQKSNYVWFWFFSSVIVWTSLNLIKRDICPFCRPREGIINIPAPPVQALNTQLTQVGNKSREELVVSEII